MWDPQLLEVLRSLSPSSRSIFLVESLKAATRNFEKLLDILEFLLTHDLKFASTNFYIENGHVERRIKPLRAGHTSKEIQKNLSQAAGLSAFYQEQRLHHTLYQGKNGNGRSDCQGSRGLRRLFDRGSIASRCGKGGEGGVAGEQDGGGDQRSAK